MSEWCHNCGLCCMHMRTPPFAGEDMERLKRDRPDLASEIEHWIDSPRFDVSDEEQPCIWLDLATGACKHHEHRPDVCRDYPVGGEDCRMQRQRVGLTVEGMPAPLENA